MARTSLVSLTVLATLSSALLAGCGDAGPEPAETSAAGPGREPFTLPVDAQARVTMRTACAQVCFGGYQPSLVFTAGFDAAITTIRLDVGAVEGYEGPVDWELRCTARTAFDDLRCGRDLAGGTQGLPIHIAAEGLDLPPGAQLWLETYTPPGAHPAADFAGELGRPAARVAGEIGLDRLAPGSFVAPLYRLHDVAFDGHSGPCNFVETGCSHYPGGTQVAFEPGGIVISLNVTLTWTSATPLDAELQLTAWPACSGSCPPYVMARGRSPLTLAAEGLEWSGGFEIEVSHPGATDAVLRGDSLVGTRTPVHVAGTFIAEVPPEME